MYNNKLILFQIFFTVFIILISGCSSSEKTGLKKTEFPVTVYVSNQYGRPGSVHLVVKISGPRSPEHIERTIANEDFEWKIGHYHKKFEQNLPEGQYQIFAESNKGSAKLDVVFTVDKPLWLIVTYIDENHFQLNISQHSPVFG